MTDTNTKPRLDLSIDIETFSNDAGSALIRQIGWAAFDPKARDGIDKVVASGNIWIDVQSSLAHWSEFSWETIKWWMQQRPEAQFQMVQAPDGHDELSVEIALARLNSVHQEYNPQHVWAKPPQFDLMLLEGLYERCPDIEAPKVWRYGSRDIRTLLQLYPMPRPIVLDDVQHTGESDAIAQAFIVQRAFQAHTTRGPVPA